MATGLLTKVCSFLDRLFSVVLRAAGPFLVLLCNALILVVTRCTLSRTIPEFVRPVAGPLAALAAHFFLLATVGNALINYWACILTRPGFPGDYLSLIEQTCDGDERAASKVRFCRACRAPKPERCHHCSVCNRCVLKMDHHCPWVNNCVGFYNYRYFLLFIFYLAAGCLVVGASSFAAVMDGGKLFRAQNRLLLFSFVLSISILLALCLFIGWHFYLAATNQTTVEFYINRLNAFDAARSNSTWTNPYDVGFWANLGHIFGEACVVSPAVWFMPSLRKPPGDGITFQRSLYAESLLYDV